MVSSTPPDDLLLVMGDFNARVGCGDDMNPSWLGVRGRFGVGLLNEMAIICLLSAHCMSFV